MKSAKPPNKRCAIYTRKSHEEGLEQEFNSLDAQRQAGEAYVESQRHEGWRCLPKRYDDGGFTGGNMDRPALNELKRDIEAGAIDCVVVYKVDRLSRSLMDFSQLIGLFDQHNVSFVSVTQQFNTSTSMGRLTLNILLSFAQFEREIIGERIRDKKLATARQGKYVGGMPVLGLDIVDKRYVVNEAEAKLVRRIFALLEKLESCRKVADTLNAEGIVTKAYHTKTGKPRGGKRWTQRSVYDLLTDRKYIGQIVHKGNAYSGEHAAIVTEKQFNRVAALLAANRTYTAKHQVQRFALLRGMLVCGHCSSRIMPAWTRNHGREYRYYTCAKKVRTGYARCPLPSIPAAELEGLVIEQIRDVLRHPDLVARAYRELHADQTPEVETAGDRLATLRQQRDQVQRSIRAALSAGHDDGFMTSEIKRLNRELKVLDAEIRQLEDQQQAVDGFDLRTVTNSLQSVDGVWEALIPQEQQRVIQLLVGQIQVACDGIEVRFRRNGIEQIIEELHYEEAISA